MEEPPAVSLILLHLDMLRRIASFLQDNEEGFMFCLRLTCKSFRDAVAQPARTARSTFFRSLELVVYAWGLPGFRRSDKCKMWELAIRVGRSDVLDWMRLHFAAPDCPFGSLCEQAAEAGQMQALQWLHSQGCLWNSVTCSSAARGGHLEVLRWAREQGCPWDKQTCLHQASGHPAVVAWIQSAHF